METKNKNAGGGGSASTVVPFSLIRNLEKKPPSKKSRSVALFLLSSFRASLWFSLNSVHRGQNLQTLV